MPKVSAARYGKDNIRVYKVHRDEATKTHTVVEMTVCVLLEGEIESSYVLSHLSHLGGTKLTIIQIHRGRQ